MTNTCVHWLYQNRDIQCIYTDTDRYPFHLLPLTTFISNFQYWKKTTRKSDFMYVCWFHWYKLLMKPMIIIGWSETYDYHKTKQIIPNETDTALYWPKKKQQQTKKTHTHIYIRANSKSQKYKTRKLKTRDMPTSLETRSVLTCSQRVSSSCCVCQIETPMVILLPCNSLLKWNVHNVWGNQEKNNFYEMDLNNWTDIQQGCHYRSLPPLPHSWRGIK